MHLQGLQFPARVSDELSEVQKIDLAGNSHLACSHQSVKLVVMSHSYNYGQKTIYIIYIYIIYDDNVIVNLILVNLTTII